MTLLLVIIVSVISTVIWYTNKSARNLKIEVLCYMYWGASIMWLVDAIFEYIKLGAEFFNSSTADMINDFYLGISIITLGLVIWIVILLIKDPKNVISNLIKKKE